LPKIFKRSSRVTAEFGRLDIDEIIEVIFFVRRSWLHPEATDRESKMDRARDLSDQVLLGVLY
jgi:hypothetical protein